ncbi:glycine betaine/L-proline ABC transporter substrate-binding protein ProX [Euzebya tangerina]|uniref:glycine betaine/L-proline ABC transporter substrate-binding protein ProX n=1 Tax=Euzebya tangerina TaxID=591198 RepID=UPI000E319CD2|nr:glycine betaine/L-proline ABC transporter substrate-binding protein ProX [Euzebya tangerina]
MHRPLHRHIVAAIGLLCLLIVTISPAEAQSEQPPSADDQVPTVRLARPTWDTGWFQAEINRILLERLGFAVDGPQTMENEAFYDAVARGDIDLWANGWFPLHGPLLGDDDDVRIVGTQVDDGALQGYFTDLATAEEVGITSLGDLADPEIAARFDTDEDGRADLIGCNLEWACHEIVEHHLTAYELTDTVEQVSGDYSPLMEETVRRFQAGEPVLYYTFTPNWIPAFLEPGEDVAWLQTPFPSLPEPSPDPSVLDSMTLADVPGCADDPCQTGWAPNDIRAVAGASFLDANPQVETLLEQVQIPLADIQRQNARMVDGEGDSTDIARHAEEWVAEHEATVQEWLNLADPDAVPLDQQRGTGPAGTGETWQVAVRTFEPFVTYENRVYGGFSVELTELLAARMGVEVEYYGVNSVAKQIDDVQRGAADLALSGISITADREAGIDFSLPVFDTGLTILVPADQGRGIGDRIRSLAGAIFTTELPWLILAFVLVLLLAAHMIWWLERRDNPDFPELYGRGIWDSFWWSAVTITTVGYGDKAPKGVAGRGFALLWMIAGYFVFASFTASITSSLAVDELQGSIAGPSDLPNHVVATLPNSPAEAYLNGQGIGPVLVGDLPEAYELLDEGEVDAIVFDAPILQFFAAREGSGRFRTVGPVFEDVRYGIAVGDDADRREQINLALLDVIESGVYDQLHDQWFGALAD